MANSEIVRDTEQQKSLQERSCEYRIHVHVYMKFKESLHAHMVKMHSQISCMWYKLLFAEGVYH